MEEEVQAVGIGALLADGLGDTVRVLSWHKKIKHRFNNILFGI